jgi:hypothetical protein
MGVPRGVPDEFKARNQILAGLESGIFWWSTLNKNVDWINDIYYKSTALHQLYQRCNKRIGRTDRSDLPDGLAE